MGDVKNNLGRKSVLIVSYHFPPDSEVGGLRAEKFAKYLPSFGWTPSVLTVRDQYYGTIDRERGVGINCDVVRTGMLSSPRGAYLKIKSLIRFVKCKLNIEVANRLNRSDDATLELGERNIPRLRRNLISLLWIPDDRIGWIYPAVRRGLQMMKDREIDTVMTTSPPHSVQFIGLILKNISKKRWVVDFRDPWSLSFQSERNFYARVNRWLERKVVENADLVIVATEDMTKGYQAAYESKEPKKFICIPNGYDPEDLKEVKLRHKRKSDKFTISYLGEFYIGRTPECFLQAVSNLIKGGYIPKEHLLIRFIGKVRTAGKKSVKDLVEKQGLSSVVQIIDPVPYHSAIDYMINSDVLLVFSPQTYALTTKVFEYMAAGAWVIAFTPSGALADLVRQYPKGMVIDYDDVEGGKEALMACYKDFTDGKAKHADNDAALGELLSRYNRKNLTEELAKYL